MRTRSKSRIIIQNKTFYPIHPIDLQETNNHFNTIKSLNKTSKYMLDLFICTILFIFIFLIISILIESPVAIYTQPPNLF
jgi:hypothetical protein